jgi:hypothetical protein
MQAVAHDRERRRPPRQAARVFRDARQHVDQQARRDPDAVDAESREGERRLSIAQRQPEARQGVIERGPRQAPGDGCEEHIARLRQRLGRLQRPMKVRMRTGEMMAGDGDFARAGNPGTLADDARFERRGKRRDLDHRPGRDRPIELLGADAADRRVRMQIDGEIGDARPVGPPLVLRWSNDRHLARHRRRCRSGANVERGARNQEPKRQRDRDCACLRQSVSPRNGRTSFQIRGRLATS